MAIKKDLAFWYFFSRKFSSQVGCQPLGGQKVVKHGGHQGISFLFID